MREEVEKALKSVIDPELGIDIVTLGLVRNIDLSSIKDEGIVKITMTLTTPLCPFADILVQDVETAIDLLGIGECKVCLDFNPPWEATEELKIMLGI